MNVSKICCVCKVEKPVEEFVKNRSKIANDGLSYYCRECTKLYQKEHYKNNKAKYLKRNSATRKKNRNLIKDYKRDKACILCGESHPACLTFHHRDIKNKDFDIGIAAGCGFGINKIKEEIAKCDVLCANCHHKLHYAVNYRMPS